MALTPAEEQELAQLESLATGKPSGQTSRLTPKEESELAYLEKLAGGGTTQQEQGIPKKESSVYGKYVRPTLQATIPAIAGGVVGVLGSPVAPPIGGITGFGLGYGAGKQAMRGLDTLTGHGDYRGLLGEISESAKNVQEGTELGVVGESLGMMIPELGRQIVRPFKYAKEKLGIPPITNKGIKQKAYDLYSGVMKKAQSQPQIRENINIARELERKMGVKFSSGQLTNDADVIQLERSLTRSGGGAGLSQQERALANKAIEDYYLKKMETGDVEGFVSVIGKQKEGLESSVKKAQESVDAEVIRISKTLDEQSIGKTIHETLSKGKKETRNMATSLYNKIPNIETDTSIIYNTIDDIKKSFDPLLENPANYPRRMINGLTQKIGVFDETGKLIGNKNMGFQDLRKIRTQIQGEIRTQQGSMKPNDQLIRRLKILEDGIEGSINTLEGRADKAGEFFREASSYYREYAKTFKQGTVADVLARGQRGEDTKIALANIAQRFNSLDGIDDFMRGVGDSQLARKSMRDFYYFDFLNNSLNAEGIVATNKSSQWLFRNAGKLKKLGIFDDFKDIVTKKKVADVAQKELDIFNKSVANRVLEADTDKIVGNAFRGSKNYAQTAQELMNLAKGNRAAEMGLKDAFTKNLLRESETTAPEFFQTVGAETISDVELIKSVAKLTNNIKKYTPAFRVIYKDEPEKIKAIMDVWNSYQILARTTRSPMGGGSDTVENLFGVLVGAGGARAGQFYLIKSIRDAFAKFSDRHVNEYLRRAMIDPSYASNFTSFKTGITPEKTRRLGLLMSTFGAIEKERD